MAPAGKTPSGFWGRQNRSASNEPDEDDGAWLNLWVGNLSPDTVDEDLMAIFSKQGAMDAAISYLPRPYAFVYFRTIDDAKAAKETLYGISIRGRKIRIEFARPAKPGKTLWVGGISQSIKEKQLHDIFMEFGQIEEYKFLPERGSAFITYYKVEDAREAHKSMNWKHLGGSEIRVDFQKSPFQKRDWAGEHSYQGNKGYLQADQLLSPHEGQYLHETPHHGPKIHHVAFEKPFIERREGQPSNVLWVGYPPEVQIDEELLHNSMILFGEIERIQSFPSRHYCYVEFRSVDEARRAKEGLQGRLLGDSRIQILFTNSEPVPVTGQDMYLNEPPIGPAELFFPGHSVGSNHFSGNLVPNVMPRPNILVRPFTPNFDPHHGGAELHEFGGGIHSIPDGAYNNPMSANWKKLSLSTPGIITPGPIMQPFRGGPDEFDIRESKRSRFDSYPSNDAHFQGGLVDGADIVNFPGFPQPDRVISTHRIQTPGMPVHEPSRATSGIDYCWRGIIAKGGTPVCHARCIPIDNGIEAPFPVVVNCSARTGIDMLTTHYTEAVGFDMVYFLPDSEEDFASYTEFLRYLGQRDRAGVAKFDDGTTMFLVPPSDFLTKVLKFSGPERLYGVVLKMPQQTNTPGHQPQAKALSADPLDRYGFVAQNEHRSLNLDYRNSTHESERPRLVLSEEPNAMPLISQDSRKRHETAVPLITQDHTKRRETTQPEVAITPELLATLASLIPTNAHPSAAFSSQTLPSSSSRMSASFSGPTSNDNNSMIMQMWGQEARNSVSTPTVEQLYNPMQNLPPQGLQYTSEASLIPQYSTYLNISNGLDNSFQPVVVGMPMLEPSLHMQQTTGLVGTVGNTDSSQAVQYQALPNIRPNDVASIYNFPNYQQIAPTTPGINHSGPVTSDRLNAGFPSQAQPMLGALSSSGQGASESDAEKDQRYQSTLQFAASLLLQIQQQQQAKAQAGLGLENQH